MAHSACRLVVSLPVRTSSCAVTRQVFELSVWVPVGLEWAIVTEPVGKTSVSAVRPGWSMPPAVNVPVAMMLALPEVGDVVMNWKCSVPELPTGEPAHG
jgi:hypothetical protein